ncbi:bh protein [Ectobacillus ponti]|uniref:Bh protein n=1 Tax=Ectobacillus ponti TaxID=2961894 RepID=A0AA42BRR9_9BACI|nr:bh protein [Ectobacillus ponti]MCP8970661.1 bh protein [Ectobacillus ponti]
MMKSSELESSFYCIHCDTEQPHVIVYINDKIRSIECENCHHIVEFKIDIMKEFYKEVYNKISRKPSKITQEYKQDLNHFLTSIPLRVVSKPFRFIRYLEETHKVIKRYKKEG